MTQHCDSARFTWHAQDTSPLSSLVTDHGQLRFDVVEFSLGELQAEADLVFDAIAADEGAGTVAIDEIANTVSVTMATNAEITDHRRNGRRGNRGIEVDYVVEPEVELDACTSRSSCGSGNDDLRGGLTLRNANGGRCTTGFVFETNAGNTFISTAGHCVPSGPDQGVTIAGESFGPAGDYEFFPGSNVNSEGSTADAVLIGIANSESSNLIYQTGRSKYFWITEREFVDYPIGSRVCIASEFSWWRCGTVNRNSVNRKSSHTGIRTVDQFQWAFVDGRPITFGGASGAPLVDGRQALGTHAGSYYTDLPNPNLFVHQMIGSKILNMEQEFRQAGFPGATVRTTR